MSEKSGITGPIVEQDNPDVPDEPSTEMPPSIKEAMDSLKPSGKSSDPGKEGEEQEQQGAEETAADPSEEGEEQKAPGEEEKAEEKPAEEPEAKTEPEDPRKVPKFTQEDIDRIIDSVIKKERSREESALKKLRDLELVAGAKVEQLLEQVRQGKIQAYIDNLGVDEATARQMVERDERLARYEAEQARIQQEREEAQKVNAYVQERAQFYSDPNVPTHIKALARKYETEIDILADNGRGLPYSVARAYVLGNHVDEIIAAQQKAAEQRVLANVQKNSKAAPIATATPPAQTGPVLTAEQKRLAHEMYPNVSKAEAERKYLESLKKLQKLRGR